MEFKKLLVSRRGGGCRRVNATLVHVRAYREFYRLKAAIFKSFNTVFREIRKGDKSTSVEVCSSTKTFQQIELW